MSERIHFWFGYVGSAALAAFLATCLQTPRVATYSCDTPPGKSHEQCELVDTLVVTSSAADVGKPERDADAPRLAVTLSAVN